MKALKSTLLLLAVLFTVLSTQSCKDECDDKVCQNGGICMDGTCHCPDGFSGDNCEIQDLCFGITCPTGIICVDGVCDCPDGYTGNDCESFDPSQVQALLDEGKTPLEIVTGGVPLDKLYGNIYLDGLIFYLDTIDGSGMVAAKENHSPFVEWGCYPTDIVGLNNVTENITDPETEVGARIGDGMPNTNAILAECMTNDIAAKVCRDIGPEWFLPSRGEMIMMYNNLSNTQAYDELNQSHLWSSSELFGNFAWSLIFDNGIFFTSNQKDYTASVRAARAF